MKYTAPQQNPTHLLHQLPHPLLVHTELGALSQCMADGQLHLVVTGLPPVCVCVLHAEYVWVMFCMCTLSYYSTNHLHVT